MAYRAEVLANFHLGATDALLTDFGKWLRWNGYLGPESVEDLVSEYLWGEEQPSADAG